MSSLRASVGLVAAVLITLPPLILTAASAHAETTEIPPSLKRDAECMYKVLKTVPGVTEPKLGYETSDGWTHPFLEYRAAEANSWGGPMRFHAKKPDNGKFWFLAITPGRILPAVGHVDIHVTDAVVDKWKAQCRVDANVLFP